MTLSLSAPLSSASAAKNPAARGGPFTAIVGFMSGTAVIEAGGKATPVAVGTPVNEGDTLTTAADGRVKLLLSDDSVVNLGSSTKFKLEKALVQEGKRQISLRVLSGRFLAHVAKWFGTSSEVEVETPSAVAGVRGTTLWGDTALDAICALDGTIEVKSTKGASAVKVEAGNCATKMAQGKTDPLKPSAEDVQKYLRDVRPVLGK